MKPASFRYIRVADVASAIDALHAEGDEAKLLAGGQSLVPMMNMRLARPTALIDISRVDELGRIALAAGEITIGAGVRQLTAEGSAELTGALPILAEALRYVGHVPIRSRGTVGGSLAHADPAAELPTVMRALDAQLTLASPRGRRRVPAADFFVTHFTTVVEADELLEQVHVPRVTERWGAAFVEVARRHGDFALVGCAALVELDEQRTVRDVRLALSGVAEVPWRSKGAEEALIGRALDEAALRELSTTIARELEPPSDIHGTSEYRRAVASEVAVRALSVAAERSARTEKTG
jgi:aerobic carbon-monoxide dehydrogenase medium subunit